MARVELDRIHAVEHEAPDVPGATGAGFLVRIHGNVRGRRLIGEGSAHPDKELNRAERREAWDALARDCRTLSTKREVKLGSGIAQVFRKALRPSTGSPLASGAVEAAVQDLLRQAGGEPPAPSQYVAVLAHMRRELWLPEPPASVDGAGREVNTYDAEINLAGSSLAFSSFLLQQAALRRGLATVRFARGDFTAWDDALAHLTFWKSLVDTESRVSEFLCDDKQLTRRLLERAGVPVPQGRVFTPEQIDHAVAYAEAIGYPVVVKPQVGRKGLGVTTGITDTDDLQAAIASLRTLRRRRDRYIVEQHVTGQDYRIYVAFGEVQSVVLRRKAAVIGDGVRDIAELVAAKNTMRRMSAHTRTRLIPGSAQVTQQLAKQQLDWSSVVEAGREVFLASAANISQGGDSIEVIAETHPSIIDAARRAVHAIPGLSQAGVDLLVEDHTLPLEDQTGGVCEINALASMMASRAPLFGPAQPIADRLLELAATGRGVHLQRSTEQVAVRLHVEGAASPAALRKRIETQAGRVGVALSGFDTDDEGLDVLLQGEAPALMRVISALYYGPQNTRPLAVFTTPTGDPVPASAVAA